MKKNKWLRLLASLVMALLLVLPTVFAGASYAEPQGGEINHITKVDFNLYFYKIGGNTNGINVGCQTDGIRVTNFEVFRFDEAADDWVYAKGTFKADESYRLRVSFKPKDGYDLAGLTKENINLGAIGNPIKDTTDAGSMERKVIFSLPILTEPVQSKLTFDTNGGNNIGPVIEMKGTKIDLTKYVPVKEGFDFDGWYEDMQLTNKITEVTLTKDMTVYAKWNAKPNPPAHNEEFAITVNPKGGNWNGDTSIKTFMVKKGEYFTLPDAPTRDGYTFKYWKGSMLQPGDKYMVDGEHEFVAVWEKNKVTNDNNNKDKDAKDMNSKNMKNSPQTGDNTSLFSLMFILLLSGISMIAISRKYNEEK